MSASIPIKVVLSDLWSDLSGAQKFIAIALFVLIVGAIASSWWQTFGAWNEIRGYRNAAIKAEREKDEAIEAAAKIATQIKVREEELLKVEVKRDAKKQDVEKARTDVERDRSDYDAAVRSRVPEAPSTDELCARFAAAGHPCQPR